MGPPPFSSRLEPDNLPELRTTMEPIRDAEPQLPLTTTPASTTAGHAPDTSVFSVAKLAKARGGCVCETVDRDR